MTGSPDAEATPTSASPVPRPVPTRAQTGNDAAKRAGGRRHAVANSACTTCHATRTRAAAPRSARLRPATRAMRSWCELFGCLLALALMRVPRPRVSTAPGAGAAAGVSATMPRGNQRRPRVERSVTDSSAHSSSWVPLGTYSGSQPRAPRRGARPRHADGAVDDVSAACHVGVREGGRAVWLLAVPRDPFLEPWRELEERTVGVATAAPVAHHDRAAAQHRRPADPAPSATAGRPAGSTSTVAERRHDDFGRRDERHIGSGTIRRRSRFRAARHRRVQFVVRAVAARPPPSPRAATRRAPPRSAAQPHPAP